jgi:xyloglucan-specific exo-beta-1,4-glucanase
MYTIDGGKHWRSALLAAGGPLPSSWQISGEWWSSQVLVPDRVEGNRFYFYADGDFYTSSVGGATWVLQSTIKTTSPGGEPVGRTVKVSIVASPARAGDLYLSFARNSNQPGSFRLLRSVDYGKSFSIEQGLTACSFVVFGKGKSNAVPFVYAFGRAHGESTDAIYKSEDGGTSWYRISDAALHGFGNIDSLEADMRTRDLVYVGTGGRGIFYGRARAHSHERIP